MSIAKHYFFLKLNPPRPSFADDMNDEEKTIMLQHVSYWTKYLEEGKVITFGPVMDPKGVFGVGVIEVEGEEEIKKIIADDPANGLNEYECYPMRALGKHLS